MKSIEKELDGLSKTLSTLWLIKGLKSDVISEKTVSEAQTLKSNFELKKHGLDTIIATSDGLPPPKLSISLPRSPMSSIKSPPENIPKKLSLTMKNDEDELRSPVMSIIDGLSQQAPKEDARDSLIPSPKYETRCFAKVIYDFEGAQNTQEMSVESGNVIEVVEMSDDG